LLCTIYILLFPCFSSAYDEERAQVNFAEELVGCAAYYYLSEEALNRSGEPETAAQSKAAGDVALETARLFRKDEVIKAWLQLHLEEQLALIDRDYGNFAILINKYGKECKIIIENPGHRLDYWRNKK
jgi:hypothetical protein